MIFKLLRKTGDDKAVYAVYRAIVAQSRQPRLYADWGVPDTVTGRFDMISLHLVLLFRRLRGEGKDVKLFSQSVLDLFFKDMDRSLREMGAGDLAVPKKIKKMGNLFYGLLESLTAALDRGDAAAVEALLIRNIYGEEPGDGAAALAAYVIAAAATLAGQPVDAILSGAPAQGAAA